MNNKHELVIRELEPYSPEEEMANKNNRMETFSPDRFSDRAFHEVKVLRCELTREQFEAVKKSAILEF